MTSRVPAALLDGQVVIVTGAARGVGKGIATALSERGASVLLVDRDEELLTATAAELGAGRIVGAALDNFGGVHGLVNNAR